MRMIYTNQHANLPFSFSSMDFLVWYTKKVGKHGRLMVISSPILGVLMAFTEYLRVSWKSFTGARYSFAFVVSSSPPTFVIVIDVSFPFSPNTSAVSLRIKLTSAPVSSRILPRLETPFWQQMFAETTGSLTFSKCCYSRSGRITLVQKRMMEVLAMFSSLCLGTALLAAAVLKSVFSACSLQTPETDVILFGDLDSFIYAHCCKLRRLIWPVTGCMT